MRAPRRRARMAAAAWPAGLALAWLLGACAPESDPARTAAGPPAPAGPAQTGVASYYGPEFTGEPTASGKPLKPHAMTAASRSLALGAEAKVTNPETGRSVTVEVTDRGPYAKGRIIDVTPKAAERLGFKEEGVARVVVQPQPER